MVADDWYWYCGRHWRYPRLVRCVVHVRMRETPRQPKQIAKGLSEARGGRIPWIQADADQVKKKKKLASVSEMK